MSKEEKPRKEIKGKEFVAALDECHTTKDVFELLDKTMDKDTLKNRLQNVRDHDLVVTLNAQVARFNVGQGLRTSHQDCVNMAADKYLQINKNRHIPYFKAQLNQYITNKERGIEKAKEQDKEAKELINPIIVARNKMMAQR